MSNSIEDIVYKLSESRKKEKPGAIVFLGAGASFTAGIPLASNIIDDISIAFKDKPSVKKYFDQLDALNKTRSATEKERANYYQLMQCLDADEIKELFVKYVKEAKLNVAHIYLAGMIHAGYVDYVVTVNFDNLMQRALALYNLFPSVHDVTTLKEKVTDTIDCPAVIHVHGQYNGNWQLNKVGELGKVKDMLENIFAKISQNRTWIVVGYSGDDPVFDTVFSSTKFDKNLYWICYKDQQPSVSVREKLINKTEYNAYCLNGYDADTFFMKLHNDLKIEEPNIYKNPFTMLETYLENVIDISGEEFSGVNQRLEISRKRVKEAISLYNSNEPGSFPVDKHYQSAIEKDNYALKLSEIVSSKNFSELDALYNDIKSLGLEEELKQNISDAYFSWAYELGESEKYAEAIEKYKTVIALNETSDVAYNNRGVMYDRMKQYAAAIPYYEKAIELNPGKAMYYYNLGSCLNAEKKFDEAAQQFKKGIDLDPLYPGIQLSYANALYTQAKYGEAIEPYRKAIAAEPGRPGIYYDLGTSFYMEKRYREAAEQYAKVVEMEPENETIYFDYGNVLYDSRLYKEAIEQYKEGLKRNPAHKDIRQAYGNCLAHLGSNKEAEQQYREIIQLDPLYANAYNGLGNVLNKDGRKEEALSILQKGEAIKEGSCLYNLACGYALSGEEQLCFACLEKLLKNEETYGENIPREEIEKDPDFTPVKAHPEFMRILNTYKPAV